MKNFIERFKQALGFGSQDITIYSGTEEQLAAQFETLWKKVTYHKQRVSQIPAGEPLTVLPAELRAMMWLAYKQCHIDAKDFYNKTKESFRTEFSQVMDEMKRNPTNLF